jgi:transposase
MSGNKRCAPYDEAFRQQMVELVASGRAVRALVKEFGCSPASIHHWVKKSGRVIDLPRGAQVMQAARAARGAASQMALSSAEREELIRLRKQVKQLQIETQILSKATAWFAQRNDKTFTMSTGS